MKKPISMIAAVSENGVIGKDGGMPWHIPEDLKHFKCLTMGCPVIMGRKTYDSIGKPLPGRENIIITRNKDFTLQDCEVSNSLGDALEHAQQLAWKNHNSMSDLEEYIQRFAIFIIGGAEIYALGMPLAQYLYITEIHATADGDAHFPAINKSEWREVSRDTVTKDQPDISFSFVKYERIEKL